MTHYATSYPAAYGGQDTCRPALSIAPLQHGISMPSLTSPRDHNSSGSSTTSSSSSSTITDGMSDVEGGDAGRVVSGSQVLSIQPILWSSDEHCNFPVVQPAAPSHCTPVFLFIAPVPV